MSVNSIRHRYKGYSNGSSNKYISISNVKFGFIQYYYAYLQLLDMLKSYCVHRKLYMQCVCITVYVSNTIFFLNFNFGISNISNNDSLKGMSKKKLESESLLDTHIYCLFQKSTVIRKTCQPIQIQD